jgi:hypothetical protein
VRFPISFYRPDADIQFQIDDFWKSDRERLANLGCRFLSIEEANRVGFCALFDLLIQYNQSFGEIFDCLPRQDPDFTHAPIPFSYEEHDKQFIDRSDLQTLIERHVNNNYAARKFLFLCKPNICIALEFDHFCYEIIHAMSTGWANDWILICDENTDQGIFFCEDGGMSFYSRRSAARCENFCGRPNSFWIDYFNANFVDGVAHAVQGYFDFVNVNYGSRIPNLARFKARFQK